MLRIVAFILAGLPFFTLSTQEGEIQYKEIIKIDIELPEGLPISQEQLEKLMPSEQVNNKILYFTSEASLFTNPPKAEATDGSQDYNSDDGSVQIKMIRSDGENKIFHDIKANKMLNQRSFLGRKFLVKGAGTTYDWKLTGASKMVAGYACQQALTEVKGSKIEAWFTPTIPVTTGPSGYMNLPGMILEVTSEGENGIRKYIAQKVDFKQLESGLLKAPKKGKKVSQEEFDQIVAEKTAEMGEAAGGNRVQVQIRN
ncbi:MAG: GLPGLI family protein [Bacteroidota bacterium]